MPDAVFAQATSAAVRPRALVQVNGQTLVGWTNWEADNNTFYQADTFRVTFALASLPRERDLNWWSQQTEVFLELFAGFPADPDTFTAAELQSFIYGRADHIDVDPVARTLSVGGRDLTSYFIDTKTTEQWRNQTASQVATVLAQRHGLTPVVVPTKAKVGGYYELDHVMVTNQHSEWDLLSYLATKEQYVVYVRGKELHFEPRPDPAAAVPYVLQWQDPTADDPAKFNGTQITFSRDLTVAKGVVVWVQAINVKTKKAFSVCYPQNKAKGTRPGQSSPSAQVYTFRQRGAMTIEEALRTAQEKHRQITQHEVKMTASLPADNVLSPLHIIDVRGTGSAFDQTYFPDSVTRRMNASGGYTMDVTAKNIAEQNEGAL